MQLVLIIVPASCFHIMCLWMIIGIQLGLSVCLSLAFDLYKVHCSLFGLPISWVLGGGGVFTRLLSEVCANLTVFCIFYFYCNTKFLFTNWKQDNHNKMIVDFKTEKLPDLARTLSDLPVDCQIASSTLPDKFPPSTLPWL